MALCKHFWACSERLRGCIQCVCIFWGVSVCSHSSADYHWIIINRMNAVWWRFYSRQKRKKENLDTVSEVGPSSNASCLVAH